MKKERNVERKSICHDLKIHPKYYEAIVSRKKTFEIRKNDRDFTEGDEVKLIEYSDGHYTHAPPIYARIGYVTDYEQKDGFVVFSIIVDWD